MKLLFAHDHKLHVYKNDYYSNGSFSSRTLQRYTNIFKNVLFISRQVTVEERPHNMSIANTEGVDFKKIPDFKSVSSYYKKKQARKLIEKEVIESDYIISRLPSEIGYIAVEFAKKHKKPFLVEVVTCPWDSMWNHSTTGKFLAIFNYYKMKKIVENSPYVVYVTKKFLQNRYPTKGNNVSCSNVALEEANQSILNFRKEKIKKQSDKKIIGTTAAVDVKFKGQQYIIKALSELKKNGNVNYEYHLVGGGDQSYLKSIAKKFDVENQVKFLGVVPHERVFDWLDTIDIYVQPSRQEGLPRALIEAMSRGLPAFGAKTAGIPELLNEKFIFSNTRRNIKEIIEILNSFDKETLLSQAERNYKEAEQYSEKIIEKRRESFFKKFKQNSNQF